MTPKIFDMLERLAIENPGIKGRMKLAAGIVYKKHLVATGVNSYKSHPLMTQFGKNSEAIFIHAEIDAIKNALRLISQEQLAKCDMYILRVKRSGHSNKSPWVRAMSRPCEGCQRAIVHFGIQNVYYTAEDTTSEDCNCYTLLDERIADDQPFNKWRQPQAA